MNFLNDIVHIDTGDAYADISTEHRLSQLPEFWALVAYLEHKGVLDREEFYDCLNQKCKSMVTMSNILMRERTDSQDP